MSRYSGLVIAVLAALRVGAAAAAPDADLTRVGHWASYALPGAALAHETTRSDMAGARQMALTWLATEASAELIKQTTGRLRPDGSNQLSFPSGHAARAFAAAAYVHRRHGFDAAWPMYLGATAVGWTRVQAERHHWSDVAGSAVLAAAMATWIVDRAERRAPAKSARSPRAWSIGIALSL